MSNEILLLIIVVGFILIDTIGWTVLICRVERQRQLTFRLDMVLLRHMKHTDHLVKWAILNGYEPSPVDLVTGEILCLNPLPSETSKNTKP